MTSQQLQLLGSLQGPGCLDEALAALYLAVQGQALELLVYDADFLPLALVEAITDALEKGVKVQVRAYRPLLMHQMIRLNLPVLAVPSEPAKNPLNHCQALVLGGSANSLDKLLAIIEALPKSNVSIFVVQHLAEDKPNLLDELLKVRTQYQVLMPQHLLEITPGTLYVSPPGFHMKVANGLVYLTRDPKVQYARPSLDVLFESVAMEYGPNALAVLLCGYGADGTAGCAAIRRASGLVFVEDGMDCNGADQMPASARKAGHFDRELPISELISLCASALSHRAPVAEGPLLGLFLKALHGCSGYDYGSYERTSLSRRITTLMRQYGYASFFDYQYALFGNPQAVQLLLTELSIKVTEFFRHPNQFALLRQEVLPYLDSFPLIKIWSAGCATGEEAYSLAMLLDELGLAQKSRLFATDINPYALEMAQSGLFPLQALELSQDNYTMAGGIDLGQHLSNQGLYLQINPGLRERLLFHHHALGHDGVFNEFELILCRNVMIYFDTQMQRKVLNLFAQSLHREGFLMLGPSDGLSLLAREAGFRPDPRGQQLYRLETRP